LKVKLDGAKFFLLEDFIVSTQGKPLTSEQVKVLRLLDIRNDDFKIKIQGYWSSKGELKIVDTSGFKADREVNNDEEYVEDIEI
jgi:hypothetical protein